jgi:hypothetical protein
MMVAAPGVRTGSQQRFGCVSVGKRDRRLFPKKASLCVEQLPECAIEYFVIELVEVDQILHFKLAVPAEQDKRTIASDVNESYRRPSPPRTISPSARCCASAHGASSLPRIRDTKPGFERG